MPYRYNVLMTCVTFCSSLACVGTAHDVSAGLNQPSERIPFGASSKSTNSRNLVKSVSVISITDNSIQFSFDMDRGGMT